MDVILMHDIPKIGVRGQSVRVANGYARNYLFPKGLAVRADAARKREVEIKLKSLGVRDDKDRKVAEELGATMADVSIKLTAAASDEDKLYGSVTAQMIARELSAKGFDVAATQVELAEPLKSLGNYSVPVRLHRDVVVEIPVWVERD